MRQGMQQSSGGNEEDPPEEAAEVTLFRHERRVDGGYQGVARPAGPEDGAETLQRVLTDLAVHPGVRDERPGAAIYPCEHESCLEIEEQQYLAEDL